jgi:type II secretory pathway component PulL
MSTTGWILELDFDRWRLLRIVNGDATIECDSKFDLSELLDQCGKIRELLGEWGEEGNKPVLVAPGSTWCMAAKIPLENVQQARHRQGMMYRLEEYLPLAAEDIVADRIEVGGSVLCVAVPIEPLKSFVDELEAEGVQVSSISPLPLLATQGYLESPTHEKEALVAWHSCAGTDLVVVRASRPADWIWLPNDGASWDHEVGRIQLESPNLEPTIFSWQDTADGEPETGVGSTDSDNSTNALTYSQAVAQSATKVLAGETEAMVELRRDRLQGDGRRAVLRPYVAAVQVAAVLFVIAIGAALMVRGNQYMTAARGLRSEQVEAFQSVFPNTRVPAGIVRRMESELTRLEGLRGERIEIQEDPPAISVLQNLVEAMPADKRFRLNEIRIENGRLYLDGEVRQHSDAEAINRLLKEHGFTVTAPSTHRLEGRRVSFRITGGFAPDAAAQRVAQRSEAD